MIIKFNKETVTYKAMLNGEAVICEIERVKDNNVSLKITPESYPNQRGSLNEFGNSISFDSVTNNVEALNKLYIYFTDLGGVETPTFSETDFTCMESLTWDYDVNTYPFRISIFKDSVISDYSSFIEAEQAKGYPSEYKDDYIVLYVEQILPEHRVILEADVNAFIEE